MGFSIEMPSVAKDIHAFVPPLNMMPGALELVILNMLGLSCALLPFQCDIPPTPGHDTGQWLC